MSDVIVAVTQTGAIGVTADTGDTFVAQVGNGGAATITVGEVSPGNALVASGTLTINSTTTLPPGSSAYAKNIGSAYAAAFDFGIPTGAATNIVVGNTTTLAAGLNATVNAAVSGSNLTLAFGVPRGANGITPTITVGNVVTGAAGSVAAVTAVTFNNGANVSLNLTIPRGSQGFSGGNGVTPFIAIGNVTTGNAGSSAAATATSSDNGASVTVDLTIPRGNQGIAGANGINGVTPSFSIGNVVTGAAGSSASVTATATNSGANVTLDLTIPRGDPGTSGSNGADGTSITLSDGTPANLGTAAAGSSTLSARADHVHNLPVIAYGNLSGVPSNFPTNTTLVSGLSANYSSISHGHNYVTSLNNLTGSLTLAAGGNVTITANGSTLTIDSKAGLDANAVIDGGDYVGQLVYGITFGTQPQSVNASSTTTVNLTSLNITANAPYLVGVGNASLIGLIPKYVSNFGPCVAIVRSTDNGTTWLSLNEPNFYPEQETTLFWVNTAVAGGTVASADNGSRVVFAHPSSGVYYIDSSAPQNAVAATSYLFTGSSFLLAYNGQRFVGVAADGNRLFTSSDGVSWTKRLDVGEGSIGFAILWLATIGTTTFVGQGSHSTFPGGVPTGYPNGGVMQSTDGVSWSAVSVSGTLPNDVASSGSRLVGVNGTTARYSVNGTTWGTATLPVSCNRISYAAGLFWAFNSNVGGTDACTSADGVSWTLQTLPSSASWIGAAAYSNVAMLHSGTKRATATIGASYGSANLTVSAASTSGSAVSYQWQSSVDAGTTWANVANATNTTLSLVNITSANSGTRYRAAASATGVATVFSQSATLTVT